MIEYECYQPDLEIMAIPGWRCMLAVILWIVLDSGK